MLLMRIRIRLFTFMRIRILIKVTRICLADLQTLHGIMVSLHGSIVCLHGSSVSRLGFTVSLHSFDVDPDPAFYFDADLDLDPAKSFLFDQIRIHKTANTGKFWPFSQDFLSIEKLEDHHWLVP